MSVLVNQYLQWALPSIEASDSWLTGETLCSPPNYITDLYTPFLVDLFEGQHPSAESSSLVLRQKSLRDPVTPDMMTNSADGDRNVTKPALNIPASSSTVSVKIIDISTIANVPMHALVTPQVSGIQVAEDAPSYSFLIEHPSGQKVLFDLGIRKDWHNLAPAIVERFKKVGHRPMAKKNVSEILDESGIGKDSIQAVIWR